MIPPRAVAHDLARSKGIARYSEKWAGTEMPDGWQHDLSHFNEAPQMAPSKTAISTGGFSVMSSPDMFRTLLGFSALSMK
jgi:hypothetical protein